MSVIQRLACMNGRRDEILNQELAKDLTDKNDKDAVHELAGALSNKDTKIQSDAIKTLYEIGYINPDLISQYIDVFIKLISGKNNRLVWGSMMALSTIAHLKSDELFKNKAILFRAIENGSVITVDNGIKTLAIIAGSSASFGKEIFPFLLNHLRTCRPKEVPQHSESIAVAVTKDNIQEFLDILSIRIPSLSETQSARVKRLINRLLKTI